MYTTTSHYLEARIDLTESGTLERISFHGVPKDVFDAIAAPVQKVGYVTTWKTVAGIAFFLDTD